MTIFGFSPNGSSVSVGSTIFFYIDSSEEITLDNLVVLINGFEVLCTMDRLSLTQWYVEVQDERLFYGSSYVVKIQITTDNETFKAQQKFTVESGVTIRSRYYEDLRRSNKTQSLANKVNPEAYARRNEWSFFQQVSNPYAKKLEQMIKELTLNAYNGFLPLANLKALNQLYIYNLNGETFHKTHIQNGDTRFIIPEVDGIDGITSIPVSTVPTNELKMLVYDMVPTRFYMSKESGIFYEEIIPYTEGYLYPVTSIRQILLPGKLVVSVQGGTQFYGVVGTKKEVFQVILKGKNIAGGDQEERITFLRNQILETRFEWSALTSVWVTGEFNIGATIGVFNRLPKGSMILDGLLEFSTPEQTGQHYWGLRDNYLVEASVNSNGIVETFREVPSEDIYRRYELGDTSGNLITPIDLAIDTDWLYVIDAENLYIYSKHREWPTATKRLAATQDADYELQFESDYLTCVPGDTITLNMEHLKATRVPLEYRVYVEKPDGTVEYLAGSDVEWIRNSQPTSYVFLFPKWTYLIDQIGSYIFVAEVNYVGGISEKTQQLIHVERRNAIAQYKLTGYLSLPDRLFTHSDGNLYVCSSTNLYKFKFYKDYMILSFGTNEIFFHEDYRHVEVNLDGSL